MEMDKEKIKKVIQDSVNEEEAIAFLESLIRIPSENLQQTFAQELVKSRLTDLGFSMDCFPCEAESIKDLPDFCNYQGNESIRNDIENIVAVKNIIEGTADEKAFLIHAHIDTSARNDVMPDFTCRREDGRLYGLGAADDKGGIAIMLLAAEAVLKQYPKLKNKLILMSTIGKRGAIGTLTAFRRGYHADAAIYLHPAETGHGFLEIKNYSMGNLDFNITIHGKPGAFRDEIDSSEISAVTEGAKIIQILQKWEKEQRSVCCFKEGSFHGLPNIKLNFLKAESSELLREDVLCFDLGCRLYFGLNENVKSMLQKIEDYVMQNLQDDEWLQKNPPIFSFGEIKATPAYVPRESALIQSVETNIQNIMKYDKDFIYQYHAGSDIRIPIIYGNTPTVGIGPLCGGLAAAGEGEWIDLADYIAGIKIVIGMIVDWCL